MLSIPVSYDSKLIGLNQLNGLIVLHGQYVTLVMPDDGYAARIVRINGDRPFHEISNDDWGSVYPPFALKLSDEPPAITILGAEYGDIARAEVGRVVISNSGTSVVISNSKGETLHRTLAGGKVTHTGSQGFVANHWKLSIPKAGHVVCEFEIKDGDFV